jgi:hypothetical protein
MQVSKTALLNLSKGLPSPLAYRRLEVLDPFLKRPLLRPAKVQLLLDRALSRLISMASGVYCSS